MGHRFAELAFTPSVREVQRELGSRAAYASMDSGESYNHELGEAEAAFIAARDSFYMATVSETGWPYLQHRGGGQGFVRILDARTLGFADFSGNRQYVSTGNLAKNDRVALFFMDYPNRTRLKVLGRARPVGMDDPLLAQLEMEHYRARVERGWVIRVEAFDWNCPQHITPRYTDAEIAQIVAPLVEENRALREQGGGAAVRPKAHGRGPLELVIAGMRDLTPRVRFFELRDPEDRLLPPIEAGAHLQVPVRLADGKTLVRQYSICTDPEQRDAYGIAVLREEMGGGGSRAVHEAFELGTRLHCGLPLNHFPLHGDARPAVLIAGGIGITPIKAMAHALKARGNAMQLHYAARSERELAFRDELARELGEALRLYRSSQGQRMDLGAILSGAPDNAVFYVCGPERLIEAVQRLAAEHGIDAGRVQLERFTSQADSQADSSGSAEVTAAR